ncbi:MAG: hypothetical protein Q8Q08_00890 [Candidatus Omnitrophota bacterium]|nr:hypothetical protein [Candidatus Omnitrophota bacterium]MDZ4243032.1 DUF6580 family putative transport protein [Candidatus Omnitrophota bacterium]
MLPLAVLILGIGSRWVIHAPNFTPVLSLALFSGFYLTRRHALWVPVLLMVVSDIAIGFHSTILFTWGSVLLISLIGLGLRPQRSVGLAVAVSFAASLLFFLVTNFGSWLMMYPPTPQGLSACYAAAVPFFHHTLVSTVVSSVVLFGAYELAAAAVRKTRWAGILLPA